MIEIIRIIRWQDIIDILLVAFILYRLFLILKGTRAFQMLVGLAILLFALVISKWMELYTVDWLVTRFWSQIILALIILFQPEIRRALAQIGKNPFIYKPTEMEESRTLEEVIKTSISLANKMIGALIVIEREIDLKDIVEMGTRLDAAVSKELLTSIFLPYSPIHDGAAIIKETRIVAAGCFLPLTLNPDINKIFGTRHRAGLGITEESDAVVIVISEETGSISVIIGGMITSELDAIALRRILTRIFIKKNKKEENMIFKKIKDIFSEKRAVN
ncbi:MAG: diadenylate cyclase CdaA [Nitrospirota bacterium]